LIGKVFLLFAHLKQNRRAFTKTDVTLPWRRVSASLIIHQKVRRPMADGRCPPAKYASLFVNGDNKIIDKA